MAVGRLARLASLVPVPVYLVEGPGARPATDELKAHPGVEWADSPRHATVLLVAGAIPEPFIPALARVHDQLSHPRATVWWTGLGPIDSPHLPVATRVGPDADVADRLVTIHRELMTGERASEADLLPDEPPNEWRGVGPNGQGGEGMMGGVPYGRPMVMPPVEGRDGLALDRLPLYLGPFLPGIPAGMVVQIGLQGDVVEEADLHIVDLGAGVVGGLPERPLPPTLRRVGLHLSVVADLCAMAGLGALACRVARVALAPDATAVEDLGRRLNRPWGLRAATDGVGVLDVPVGGQDPGDVTSRWRNSLSEARHHLTCEDTPGESRREVTCEDLRGLSAALVGSEVGKMLLTLASLRVELEDLVSAQLPVPAP